MMNTLDFHYPWAAAYDYEAALLPCATDPDSVAKTTLLSRHSPISCSVACTSALKKIDPSFEKRFFCLDDYNENTSRMNVGVVEWLYEIQKAAEQAARDKRSFVQQALHDHKGYHELAYASLNKRLDRDSKEKLNQFALYKNACRKAKAKAMNYEDWLLEQVHVDIKFRFLFHKSAIARLEKDQAAFDQYCSQLPVYGFNSRKYDLALNSKHGLFQAILRLDPTLKKTKSCSVLTKGTNNFTLLSTPKLRLQDLQNYVAANTSLRSLYKSVLGIDEKGDIPYEGITSLDCLKMLVREIPMSWFESKLKDVSSEEVKRTYEKFMVMCSLNGLRTLRDALEFYNNNDVVPMAKCIEIMSEQYYTYGLDMGKDAMTLPCLVSQVRDWFPVSSQLNVYYNKMFDQLPNLSAACADEALIRKRLWGYGQQDAKRLMLDDVIPTERLPDVTSDEVIDILQQCKGHCRYCLEPMGEFWSLDRIDNRLGHVSGNCIASCRKCNTTRQNRYSFLGFLEKSKQDLYFRTHPVPMTITDEGLYDDLRKDQTGGPSIVFHRYMECDPFGPWESPVSTVQTLHYEGGEFHQVDTGNPILVGLGHDANSLYGWAMRQDMPCGVHTRVYSGYQTMLLDDLYQWDGPVEDMSTASIMFIKADWHVPEHLIDKFASYPPLYVKQEIPYAQLTPQQKADWPPDRPKNYLSTKLIATMSVKNHLYYLPYARWLVRHGIVLSNVRYVVTGKASPCYRSFIDEMTNRRRQADVTNDKVGEMVAKLCVTSSYGTLGMNQEKHTNTKLTSDVSKVHRAVFTPQFQSVQCFEDGSDETAYLINQRKKKIRYKVPLHVNCAILDLAKLRMLQFTYDFLYKFIDPKMIQKVAMDTDSDMIGLSHPHPEQVKPILMKVMDPSIDESVRKKILRTLLDHFVRPEMKDQYMAVRDQWLPSESMYAFDSRTPGLFKVDALFFHVAAMSSKFYLLKHMPPIIQAVYTELTDTSLSRDQQEALIVKLPAELQAGVRKCLSLTDAAQRLASVLGSDKVAAKGIRKDGAANKQALTDMSNYRQCLDGNGQAVTLANTGIRMLHGQQTTYRVHKRAIHGFYDKMGLFPDRITCFPWLDRTVYPLKAKNV
jgi:hypothetical protein